MTNMGKNPHKIDTVKAAPDWVVRVMCHMIAYCTSMEPNMLTVWLMRNNMIDRFQEDWADMVC
jgi:hypothetical protein